MDHQEGVTGAFARLPDPPPLQILFTRRAKWLIASAGAVSLVLIAGMAVVLTSRAASSAAAGAAQRLAAVKSEYSAADSALRSQAESFQTLVAGDVANNDMAGLAVAADEFASNLAGFDVIVQRLEFPPSMGHDVAVMLSDDVALATDLGGTPADSSSQFLTQAWVSVVRADYTSDASAHDKLSADLGLTSAGFAGAPDNTI